MGSHILQFIAGTILLYYGAEFLIKGSKTVASKFKIPPIVVGITLVAFGTSLPELIVSILANLRNEPGLVVGNVVGSNVANIGLVLGTTAIISPIYFTFHKIRFDLYFLLVITLLPLIFIYSGSLVFWQGLVFIFLLCGYCWYLIVKDHIHEDQEYSYDSIPAFFIATQVILGISGLGFGAHFFVLGAKGIAIALGVSSLVIGMSIVALGTSLPELAASITAVKHQESGFVIGNIIGSNIINIVAVLGFTILIRPILVEPSELFSQGFFLVLLTVGLILILKFKGGITKSFAGFFMLIYILFLYLNFHTPSG